MSEPQIINWTGQSGKTYTHHIHPIDTTFKEAPGNYLYAKESSPGRWSPLYIGQTKNLSDRLGKVCITPFALSLSKRIANKIQDFDKLSPNGLGLCRGSLSNHEKENCARRQGATHIHAHVNSGGETARLAEEKDLIGKWSPHCNVQLK